ncbi:MAG: histidine kinase [Acidobacteria bacterium]|nr:histidine kinase [Acidobacteriota bacterium]
MLEQHLVVMLVKLAVAASLASIMARFSGFKRMLMREERTLEQRIKLALGFMVMFGSGVAIRVVTRNSYQAVDLGLEASMLAGIVGGYVAGLASGVLISIPAMVNGEFLSMPLFAAVGVLGGLMRDCAPGTEEIWRFSPFFDLSLYRFFHKDHDHRRTAFHLFLLLSIVFAEFLRWSLGLIFGWRFIFALHPGMPGAHPLMIVGIYVTTLFGVSLPLKIWNNTRNETKLETQARLLNEARLQALTSQINPHFLFNTLNSVSSLIRTNPERARAVVYRLSHILRKLLRKGESFTPLREELSFIDDYLAIEMVRFGDKLRFEKDVDPETLDRLAPSMILQPLIENSIKHGLSAKVEGGTVRVGSRLRDGRLCLVVSDDGVGISEARLATLLEQGIGVSNVNERLKVFFGADYRMTIDSKPGEGTRTEIELPPLVRPVRTDVNYSEGKGEP